MSAQKPHTGEAILWHREPEQTGAQPKPVLRGWLKETGLLTARLRRLCDNGFSLEVLPAITAADLPDVGLPHSAVQRRVILYCGQQACIYAETEIPAATLARHPWLSELGAEPLGERLQSRPDVQRTEFRYAQVMPGSLPPPLAGMHHAPLWARQSDFSISATVLTVTEVFLSGLIDYEHQRMKLAD